MAQRPRASSACTSAPAVGGGGVTPGYEPFARERQQVTSPSSSHLVQKDLSVRGGQRSTLALGNAHNATFQNTLVGFQNTLVAARPPRDVCARERETAPPLPDGTQLPPLPQQLCVLGWLSLSLSRSLARSLVLSRGRRARPPRARLRLPHPGIEGGRAHVVHLVTMAQTQTNKR